MKLFKIILAIFVTSVLFSACKKEYSIENGGLKLIVGNWEFTDSAKTYTGNMDSAFIVTTGATKDLHLNGTSSDGSQNFNMVLYADSFNIGSYKASLFQSSFDYTTTAKTIYQANQLVGEFIVNITSISSSLITGTFSGSALDSTNTLTNITLGKFKSTLGGQSSAPTSSGVLGDSSGNCKPVILNGVYTQGMVMTAANTVQVQVTVTVPGTYSIFTNSVNGITFSNTGTFANAGPQNVILTAIGTSALSGNQIFTLNYGNSQCSFDVNFLAGVSPSGDYYPLTINSNWTYGEIGAPVTDSFTYKVVNNSAIINGNTYSDLAIYDVPPAQPFDSSYLRKQNGIYYSYLDYAAYFSFDQPVFGEIIILKDNVPQGATWVTPTVTGTIAGVSVQVHFNMTILAKGIPEVVGGFSFPDVIKVKMDSYVGALPIGTTELWYARNVGLIYMKQGTSVFQAGRFQIF